MGANRKQICSFVNSKASVNSKQQEAILSAILDHVWERKKRTFPNMHTEQVHNICTQPKEVCTKLYRA